MYKIISDGSCDLEKSIAEKLDVKIVPFYVSNDGETYKKEIEELNVRDFYEFLVKNPTTFPKTSLPTVSDYIDVFEPLAKQGIDVVCICTSTKLSGSYNSATNARDMILEDYPNVKIAVIDSHVNTVLHGLLVIESVKMRDSGLSYEEIVSKIEELKSTGRIFFTVENIDYLVHGGRIGKLLGSATKTLNLRPLIVLREGEIHAAGIARGRKKSLDKVLELMIKHIQDGKNDLSKYALSVGYGYDIEEGTKFFNEAVIKLKEVFPNSEPDIILCQIGATISVHTGPHPLGFGVIEKF